MLIRSDIATIKAVALYYKLTLKYSYKAITNILRRSNEPTIPYLRYLVIAISKLVKLLYI